MYSLYIGRDGGEKIPAADGILSVTALPAPRTAERRYIDGDRCRIMSGLTTLVLIVRIGTDAAVDMLLEAGLGGQKADFRFTLGRFELSGTGTVLIDRIYSRLAGCEAEIRIVM